MHMIQMYDVKMYILISTNFTEVVKRVNDYKQSESETEIQRVGWYRAGHPSWSRVLQLHL